ncbi:MAG: 50S ribosomal protein L21 [Endomicrobiia bacterium]
MYAVVEIGGKQYVVDKENQIVVEKVNANEKEEYLIDKVLLIKKDDGIIVVGSPHIKDSKVISEVVSHAKTKKVIVFRRSKSKKNWRKKIGHRQNCTILKIKDIVG